MNELYHHGIKGQKWGVRRYQTKNGSLTPAGIKRYAQAGYAQDAIKSNKSSLGKIYDRVTGAHKMAAQSLYNNSSSKENKARAMKYIAEQQKKSNAKSKSNINRSDKSSKSKSKTVYKPKKKAVARVASGLSKVGKFTLANAMRMQQNKHAMAAIDSLYKGDMLNTYINAVSYSQYSRAGSALFK